MVEWVAWGLAVVVAAQLALGGLPAGWANRRAVAVRRWVTGFSGLQLLAALAVALSLVEAGSWQQLLYRPFGSGPIALSFYVDGLTALMLLLVGLIGCVVCRYSVRYLDGESNQGAFFRWLGLTLGGVGLTVISGNLLLFLGAWGVTSWGLHGLLLHYWDRPGAREAAWTKFVISRLGDGALALAAVCTWFAFGTLELAELYAAVQQPVRSAAVEAYLAPIGWLLVLGAALKSAQFPFHLWLPLTLETPTPVSALMHAGIVNAGGYLVLRCSPLLVHAPGALTGLAMIGAVTACFGGLVMLVQPSVKRALAYSTVAQMGFMMLQCGLGAFAAAMLHIVAHSLYKAHAFLNCGQVIQEWKSQQGVRIARPDLVRQVAALGLALAATAASFGLVSWALGLDYASKPGGLLLAGVLCLSMTTWGWRMLTFHSPRAAARGLLGIAGLNLVYLGSYRLVAAITADGLPAAAPAVHAPGVLALGVGLVACLWLVHVVVLWGRPAHWLGALYVHAANGFYLELLVRRWRSVLAARWSS